MAKWDGLRKDTRNKTLVKFKDDNPHLSYQEIGFLFDVTRQRAQQIYKDTKKREAK